MMLLPAETVVAGQRIDLGELDEMPVGILHDHRARLVRGAHADRGAARGDDANAGLLQRRKRRVDVSNQQDQRRRPGILNAAMHRAPLDVGELDQLHATADVRHPGADEAEASLGQTVKMEVSRIGVPWQRAGRRSRHRDRGRAGRDRTGRTGRGSRRSG